MPCDQVRMTSVEFKEATDIKALARGLESLGHHVWVSGQSLHWGAANAFREGKLIVAEGTDVNQIKRAYSTEIVTQEAKRQGWNFQVDKAFTPDQVRITIQK